MIIGVYIDSCAWNYLYEHAIVLERELPPSRFAIYVTREVEIELSAIRDDGCDGVDSLCEQLKLAAIATEKVLPYADFLEAVLCAECQARHAAASKR